MTRGQDAKAHSIDRPADGPRWRGNSSARTWTTHAPRPAAIGFHRTVPYYAPTPLTPVPRIAAHSGVGSVWVKDESQRMGLPAFKILGASYAIARMLSDRLGLDEPTLPLGELKDQIAAGRAAPRLIAATDGNHGRAVAHIASCLGLPSTICVPAGVSEHAQQAIAQEGAEVIVLDAPYDDVVAHAAALASQGSGDAPQCRPGAEAPHEDALLVQDTSWPGYEEVPKWIVDGYDTLLAEVDEQLAAAGSSAPDLVIVPAGVGSLAQAVVAHYRTGNGPCPAVLAVEPDTAASVMAALRAGEITPVHTASSVMAGLNCGTVSQLAWPVLRGGLDAAVVVSDREAIAAARRLHTEGIEAGPCGSATLAALEVATEDPRLRELLGLDENSVVVLLSTEGGEANPAGLNNRPGNRPG